MSYVNQQITNPLGITVFGSTILRVSPDVAVLNFSVTRTLPTPQEAFSAVREGTTSVRQYLAQANIQDVQSSRVELSSEFSREDGQYKFIGYQAKTRFTVMLSNLEMLEEVLIGIVEAGVNNLGSVDMQTTQLKDVRARARRQAVIAAREKAELYCSAAQVNLGAVLHIEDVNPNSLRGYEGHVQREMPVEDVGNLQAFDPGSIAVSAAVMLSFQIETD